jgi:hypothetical protein
VGRGDEIHPNALTYGRARRPRGLQQLLRILRARVSAERAKMMEILMMARATGDTSADRAMYELHRREFRADEMLKPLLPDFVRTCRTLDVFWFHIKERAGGYAERRQIISTALNPLLDHLEQRHRARLMLPPHIR